MFQKKTLLQGVLEGFGYRKGRPVGTFPIIDRGSVACVALRPFMNLAGKDHQGTVTPFESTWSRFSSALTAEQKRRVQNGINT
jgi:hypothetical protein